MKIAILADPLDNQNAGVHIYTKHLVKELIKQEPKHKIILIRQHRDNSLKNIKQIIIPNINLPIGFASIRLFAIIPIILRKEKVDVVIEPAHFGPFNLPSRIKRVTVIHDLTPIIFPGHHRWHSQILQKLFLKRILNKSDLIITNSKNTSRDLENQYGFTRGKNIPIYLGKDTSFKPIYDKEVLIKHKINQPYLLSVGTIEPRKNLSRLIKAYEKFNKELPDAPLLVIVGGIGWKSELFLEKLRAHPNNEKIKMLGYVDKKELPAIYSQSLSLIYPSLYEGFGFPVLEAMACGSLVICSANSSLPEVGGKAPFYINPESIESIVEAMILVTNLKVKEREERKDLGISQAKKFTWERFGDKLMKALDQLGSKE